MTEATKPKLTKQMMMHLNGGSNYSELQYQVFADDKPTKIYHTRRTDGSPNYKITQDVWWCGEEYFDAMEKGNEGLLDWLHAQVANLQKSEQ